MVRFVAMLPRAFLLTVIASMPAIGSVSSHLTTCVPATCYRWEKQGWYLVIHKKSSNQATYLKCPSYSLTHVYSSISLEATRVSCCEN
ncbi:hypothetical protein DFH27DRAFT_558708 [Peziza echinospora]|nr:hypothetical protein DFH27DRAFT_558708 [Peziza echinospora]